MTSPGGVVNVFNNSGEAVEIYVDGSRTATMQAGERQTVDRIISGLRDLTAVGLESKGKSSRAFDLKIGEPVSWQIERFGQFDTKGNRIENQCALDVVNQTMNTISVTVNNGAPVTLAAGTKQRISGLETGLASVQAVSEFTGLMRAAEVPLRPEVIPLFAVMEGAGAVRFNNRSGRLATVSAENIPARQVENGKTATFTGIPRGRVRFTAVDVGRRLLGVFDLDVRNGEVIDMVINQPAGVLNVVSDIEYPVTIYADGVMLGTCPARGGAQFQGLVIGNDNLKAYSDTETVVAQTWMEIKPDTNLWVVTESRGGTSIKAGTGAIEVENPSREPVQLYVDGNLSGTVDAGARRLVVDLKPGSHNTAVVGSSSGSLVTASVTVRDGQKARWKVAMPVSTLSVANSAAEPVNVYADGRLAGRVDKGATGAFQITQGEHRVEITGAHTRNGIARTMVFPAGTTTSIPYSGPMVTVVATNYFTDPVEIKINERAIGTLKPNERLTISDVAPGTLRLTAVSTERPVNMTVMIDLSAGDAFDWNINQ